jgi:hypothetical protein
VSLLGFQVVDGRLQDFNAVSEMPEPEIAARAKQTADASRTMVVIHMRLLHKLVHTDAASVVLRLPDSLELTGSKPICAAKLLDSF